MRVRAKKILGVVLPMALFLISSHVQAQEKSQGDQTLGAKGELSASAPDLADIVPLAAKLTGHLAALENGIKSGPDISAVETGFAGIEANLKGPADQLHRLKDSRNYRYRKLVELREKIEQENERFEKIHNPFTKAIRQLGDWRKEWLAEKKRWNEWESSLHKEGALDQIKSTFAKADDTITTALNLLISQLEAMLRVQEKAGNVQAKIDALTVELDGLILAARHGDMVDKSPPMFSSRYFSQFGSELWLAVQNGLDEISWPDSRFFAQQGWVVLLQGFLFLFVIIAVYRNREALKASERWRFLAARPFSAGFFLGAMTALLIYENLGVPATWKLAIAIVGGISFARLSGGLTEVSWKRRFVYGLITVFMVNRLMDLVSLPLPLFRLYTVLTALVGLVFCFRWSGESKRHKDSGLYAWSLRLGSFFLVFIVIAQLWGKERLAEHLFVSMTGSIAIALIFMLFMSMVRGGVEWVFNCSPLQRITLLRSNAAAIIRRVAPLIDVVIGGLVLLPAILMIWGVYDNLKEATKGLLALGFNLGSQRISVGVVIASAAILYGSFLASWIFQKLLKDEVLVRRRVERGVRLSIGRLVHYGLIILRLLAGTLDTRVGCHKTYNYNECP